MEEGLEVESEDRPGDWERHDRDRQTDRQTDRQRRSGEVWWR